MNRIARVALFVLVSSSGAIVGACKRSPDPTVNPPVDTYTTTTTTALPHTPGHPPSCSDPTASMPFPEAGTIGTAAIANGTMWIGATRARNKPVHGVYRVSADLANGGFLELGPAQGDEPPPEVALAGGNAVVATYAGKRPRRIALSTVPATGDAVPLETFPVDEDESYALAIATHEAQTVVVWDGELEKRGVIYAKVPGSPAVVVSPPTENASSPSIVSTTRGFFVAWIAERSVSAGIAEGGASHLETPGEIPTYRGLQGIHLDAKGAVEGALVRFGSSEGQIVSFELGQRGGDTIAVAIDRRVRGASAATRLVRFALPSGDGQSAPKEEEWIKSNVGYGGLSLFPGFVFVADDRERALLVSQGKSRSESRLDGATPLVLNGESLYVARSGGHDGGAGSELRIDRLTCRIAF